MPSGPKSPIKINLTEEYKTKLKELLECKSLEYKTRKQIAVIFMLAEGCSISLISQFLNIDRKTIRRWAYKFLDYEIIAFFQDIPRPESSKKFSNKGPGIYITKRKKLSCKYSEEEVEIQKFTIGIPDKIINRMLRMN